MMLPQLGATSSLPSAQHCKLRLFSQLAFLEEFYGSQCVFLCSDKGQQPCYAAFFATALSPRLTPFEALCTVYALNPDVHKTVIHLPGLGSRVLLHHIIASGCGGCKPNIPKCTL